MKILALFAVLTLGAAVLRAEDKPALEQARKKFEAADAGLNKVYKADMTGLDQAESAKLREDERGWIAYRDSMSEGMAQHTDDAARDDPQKSVDYWTNMTSFTRHRIDFLKAWTGKNVPQGITGTYSDSYGATLDLEETRDGIKFSLIAVRGSALHNGEIEGVIQRKVDKAYFKQKLDPGDSGPACELAFTFIGGHIVKIEEKAPDSGAGMGVHYNGEYYKTGKSEKPSPTPSPESSATATPPPPQPQQKPTVDQARKTFEATDNLLTIAYKEAGAGLDPGKMTALRQSERDWIQYREMLAKSAPYFDGGAQSDSKGTVDYWQTMDEISRTRIDFLRAYTGKKVPPGITAVYTDSYGGTLELEEKKSGLAFSINTTRGMARNQGEIEGVAQRTGDKASFKDHPDPGDDRAPCEITFTFIEGHIVKIEEKNGDYYHGFNANFDGVYYKTGKLEKSLKGE